jgi:hypothetical protein
MKSKIFLLGLLLCSFLGTKVFAHPGSGIVIDEYGQIYFTDTGKGVWKIDLKGQLSYIPASRFHWMSIDPSGYFAGSPKNFGQYFERVTAQNSKPTLVMCSDFPLVVNKDGNIYYADTRQHSAKIIRRTPDGKESVFMSDRIFEFINGMAVGQDSSIYITESSNPNANTIRKISLKGQMSIVATFVGKNASDLPLETTPSYCRGLFIDSTGNSYVAATGSRSVVKINPQGKIETILQEQSPWTPTGVTIFKGEVYVLEWHDVPASLLEERTAWIPRVRKIDRNGKITTVATVSR